jgi:cell division protein FtsI (penicillin-binding protein 3)
MSIGYEIGVTALQMASAFATIANDGIRVQPHIIKEVRRSDDQPAKVTQPQQSTVVSTQSAQNLMKMLRQVVQTGTGRRAQLNGYTAAGKTGTAWKFNAVSKSIDSSKYISSFIGIAPADHPEIVIAVVMDEPKAGARDGGMVSAPVFREIAQHILHEMKIMPDEPIKQESFVAQDIPEIPAKKTQQKAEAADKQKTIPLPAAKDKGKDLKKTDEKKLADAAKLTALLLRSSNPRYRRPPRRTHIEA